MISSLNPSGDLRMKRTRAQQAPVSWRVRNTLRWNYAWGYLVNWLAKQFSRLTGAVTITSELALRKRLAGGEWVDYGIVGYRLVTDAGVGYLVDDFDNASGGADVSLFNFHGVGTGTTAEGAGDTALVTESTTILTSNSVRATGTRSQPAANQFRSTGVVSFDGSGAITEHGLFTDADVGEGVLWDRTVFSAVNVSSGESLSAQYTVTVNSGG